MRQESIKMRNFRNYNLVDLQLSPQVNVFYGENAQGKTNFLEAVSYLVLGRSFRTHRDEELIREGEEGFFLKGEFREKNETALVIEIGHDCRRFLARINGVKYRKKKDLFGRVKVVIFSPDDLQLIKGGPSYRREFLDLYLAQAYPVYRNNARQYYRVLQQRNRLLKKIQEGNKDYDLLDSWTQELITNGSRVIFYRLQGLHEIGPWVKEYHRRISGTEEEVSCSYQGITAGAEPIQPMIEEEMGRRLRIKRNEEIKRGMTLIGPHLDDLCLTLNKTRDLRSYGSQGQQRTAALSLKLAMVDLLAKAEGTPPLLLLDDVFSEFDNNRKRKMLRLLTTKTQTLITTTDPQTVDNLGGEVWFFHVKGGMIVDRGQP